MTAPELLAALLALPRPFNFEAEASAFLAATGYMALGKDIAVVYDPSDDYVRERSIAWKAWCAGRALHDKAEREREAAAVEAMLGDIWPTILSRDGAPMWEQLGDDAENTKRTRLRGSARAAYLAARRGE